MERIHQQVARKLGIAILSGEVQPGDRIGNEIQLSVALGVSRTAYREALRILVAKGLVESRPKAGTRVTPREDWALLDPECLAWIFEGKPDDAFIHDLFEMRYIIEPSAAFLAADRRTEEQLSCMRIALHDMQTYKLTSEKGQAADREFHRLLLRASHNAALATLSSSISSAVQWTTIFKARGQKTPRDPLPEHQAVLAAIEVQDRDAAMGAMRQLLRSARFDLDIPLPSNVRDLDFQVGAKL